MVGIHRDLQRNCPECGGLMLKSASLCGRCSMLGMFADADADTVDDRDEEATEGRLTDDSPAHLGFHGYRILECIGRGGMGVVYKAEQISLGRTVAIKVLGSVGMWDASSKARFRVESEAVAQLEHPNIVPVYDYNHSDGKPYMVMKWVDGVGLNRWMAQFRKDPLFPGSAKRYSAGRAFEEPVIRLAQVARGVHHAHQRGFIHRDLKPSNILIDQSNVAFVTDFGLARKIGCESDLTLTGQILGTPSFMSPEQARGDLKSLTVATDIFSLGAILYWMLTGKPPFKGESTAELLRHIEEDEPQPPSIVQERLDRDLEVVCLKCLRKDPADRYSSAQELAADLERWMRGERVLARPQSRWERVVGWSRRNPVVARLSVATAVLLVSFTGYLAVSRDQLKALAES